MPRLTRQQMVLADEYVATGSVTEAARRAGYAHLPSASRALQTPHTQARVAERQRARLENEALPLAIDTVMRVMRKERARDSDRIAAAKAVIVVSGKLGLLDDPADQAFKGTKAELAAMLEHYRKRRLELEQATDVEEEPSGGAFD